MIQLNGVPIVATIFPDKTSQVWNLAPELMLIAPAINHITWVFEAEAEFMQLAQLQYLLKASDCTSDLYMPYLPYARQDKAVSNNQTFALRPFLALLAGMGFDSISAFDPHNESAIKEHLSNFEAVSPLQAINAAINELKPDLICYPDAGAQSRYAHLIPFPNLFAKKVRNQSTGVIESLGIAGDFQNKTVLIIDDICDGGMTFIRLAQALKGASQIHLYVSHGVFSKGTAVLRLAGINRLFTKEGEHNE